MNRQRRAQAVTVAVLAGALGFALYRQGVFAGLAVQARQNSTPQDAIYAMLDAAREGNVAAYLAAHTGQMEVALRKSVADSGDAAFAKYLRDSNLPVKGVALQEPRTLTDREVIVRVEFVYQDRNESQTVFLERVGAAWKIARVDAAERVKTLVPYGTPVQ